METPGGFTMSVAMTNCGALGWVSDRRGYRYDRSIRTAAAVAADAAAVPRAGASAAAAAAGSKASSPTPA